MRHVLGTSVNKIKTESSKM